jgi:hypothetical protein
MSGNAVVLFSQVQRGQAAVLVVGANGVINVAANTIGGASDIGNPANNDFIVSATISSIWWSTAGTITILRGSSAVLELNYSGAWLKADGWPGCNLYSNANLTVNVPDANSSVYLILSKEYAGGSGGFNSGV